MPAGDVYRQLPTKGIADLAVTLVKLADGSVNFAKLGQLGLCIVSNSGALVIPTAAATSVVFDTEAQDPYSWHAAGSSANIVPTRAGLVAVVFSGSFLAGAGTRRTARILKNGVVVRRDDRPPVTSAGNVTSLNVAAFTTVNGTTDIISADVSQDTGANLNLDVNAQLAVLHVGTA